MENEQSSATAPQQPYVVPQQQPTVPKPYVVSPQQPKNDGTALKIILGILACCLVVGILAAAGIVLYAGRMGIYFNKALQTSKSSGKLSVSSSKSLPSTFPSDIPIYSGLKVESTVSTNNSKYGYDTLTVVFSSEDPYDQIISFYRTEFPKRGYKVVSSYNYSKINSLSVEKGNNKVYISASSYLSKTTITITVARYTSL